MTSAAWTFLTNHAHVLICLYRDPALRARDLAEQVGITERAVMRIISELVEAGCIEVQKEGRRNRYVILERLPLRHPVESHHQLADLLKALA